MSHHDILALAQDLTINEIDHANEIQNGLSKEHYPGLVLLYALSPNLRHEPLFYK
ncbi:hypothetical protein D3C76_1628310 [compost metagenome]